MTKAFLLSLLMIFVAACTPQSSMATATASPFFPTSGVISTTTKTSPLEPFSPTSDIIPTATKISPPKIIPTLTATLEFPDQSLHSPNGEFSAALEIDPQVINILDKNGSLVWEILYQYETATVDPHPNLSIYGWSKDSLYLYFYYEYSPDGGDFAFWWEGYDLQRINVQNGEIEQVIPGERRRFVAFAFSPDETQLAYAREQDHPSLIVIRDLVIGTEKAVKVIFPSKNYVRVGDIHWSPLGDEIAFQTEASEYIAQTIYLNPSTMEQKVVREYLVGRTYFQGWSADGNFEFIVLENGTRIVHVNPRTGETMVIGTPTPQP